MGAGGRFMTTVARDTARDGMGHLDRTGDEASDGPSRRGLLGTLVQTHTEERVLLDDTALSERFATLLVDRVTGSSLPRTRACSRRLPSRAGDGVPIELVSGFRSPKLNEMMRKKGRHVASHSQHSLGHAVDFRVVPAAGTHALIPPELEREIRRLGWDGGVGVYLSQRLVRARRRRPEPALERPLSGELNSEIRMIGGSLRVEGT